MEEVWERGGTQGLEGKEEIRQEDMSRGLIVVASEASPFGRITGLSGRLFPGSLIHAVTQI